jgi:hypothetical protein
MVLYFNNVLDFKGLHFNSDCEHFLGLHYKLQTSYFKGFEKKIAFQFQMPATRYHKQKRILLKDSRRKYKHECKF